MTVTLTSEQIVIDRIKVDKDRKPDEEIVRLMLESIPLVGVLHPIVLCRPAMGLGISLVFGRNRLEACRRLKHRAILARVVNGKTPEIIAWCAQAIIDENIIRRICLPTPNASVISLIARRQAVAAA